MLPAIAASSNGRLVAIAARDASRAREFAARLGVERVAATYEAVLEDPEVDAVYIPLVNSLHKEWTLRALVAGKHVLCEKPLGMNAAEAVEMAAAAGAAGRHLMEAFMYRFAPRTRALVDEARDALYVNATFGFEIKDKANYRLQPALGGGALLDVGCYTVSVARWILGEPDQVFARVRPDGPQGDGVDMTVSALLHFPNGATASVWASFESAEEQALMVVTRDRTVRLANPFTSLESGDPYQLMVESFADSVLHDRPVAIPLSESVANMKVLDRIREAATTRKQL